MLIFSFSRKICIAPLPGFYLEVLLKKTKHLQIISLIDGCLYIGPTDMHSHTQSERVRQTSE